MAGPVIGLIGGSSLREPSLLEAAGEKDLDTPYGQPSGAVVVGRAGSVDVLYLPRHGVGHTIPPHRLNHRANLWALKELGATHILATASTGSLRKSIRPGTVVVPHDFVSFWQIPTFHDEDVYHATPEIDDALRDVLFEAAKRAKVSARAKGVYVQTSGPRLETRAEIAYFAALGDVVGMTMASEATLASELEIPYACLCSVDNYCNGIVERPLTYKEIARTQGRNVGIVRDILRGALEALG